MYCTGLSDDILAQDVCLEHVSQDTGNRSMSREEPAVEDVCAGPDLAEHEDESRVGGNNLESFNFKESPSEPIPSDLPVQEEKGEDSGDVELGGFFLEEAAEVLPPEVLEMQKKKKMRELFSEKNLEKLDGIWKKVISKMQ